MSSVKKRETLSVKELTQGINKSGNDNVSGGFWSQLKWFVSGLVKNKKAEKLYRFFFIFYFFISGYSLLKVETTKFSLALKWCQSIIVCR